MPKIRFDYVELKAVRTDEGYLKDSPIVSRTGILTYRNADGTLRKELRRPEQVFNKDSLSSYSGKPITVDHPKNLVNHTNVDQHQVGTMLSEGRQDGENVRVDTIIHKPDKIGDRRQLSIGYDVDLIETPGEYNGERYDAEQTNIRVNHLSVVKNARAGAQARLNLDSDEEPLDELEKPKMPKIRLDNGIEYEASQEVVVEVEKLRTDSAALKASATAKDIEIATLKSEKDKLTARVDGIPAEVAKAIDTAKTKLAERSKLEETAKQFKIDSKDKRDAEIMHAVIKTFNKDFDPKDKSEEYVKAAFDIAAAAPRNDNAISQRTIVNNVQSRTNKTDSEDDPMHAYINHLGSNPIVKKD